MQIVKYQDNNPAGRQAAMQVTQTTALKQEHACVCRQPRQGARMNLSSFSLGAWRSDSKQHEDIASIFEHVEEIIAITE